jgi:hypothetical protein
MSFPRLAQLPLLAVICLPLVTAGCGVPLAVSAVSYGADGASLMKTGKTGTDHLISMTSKQDCAMWRMVKGQPICKDREDGKDPYDVDYTTPERVVSEDGVSYMAPPRPPAGAPASSWDATVYKSEPKAPGTKPEPTTMVAEHAPETPVVAPPPETTVAAPPPRAASPKKKGHAARPTPKARKLSQGSAASRS